MVADSGATTAAMTTYQPGRQSWSNENPRYAMAERAHMGTAMTSIRRDPQWPAWAHFHTVDQDGTARLHSRPPVIRYYPGIGNIWTDGGSSIATLDQPHAATDYEKSLRIIK